MTSTYHKAIYQIPFPSPPIDALKKQWHRMRGDDSESDLWPQYGGDVETWTIKDTDEHSVAHDFWSQFERQFNLTERDRPPQYYNFGPDSGIPIHKDPVSLAWIAVAVVGTQPIEFFDDDKNKVYETQYQFALVNSKQYHRVDVRGGHRVLLRKIFTETSYETLFQLLN